VKSSVGVPSYNNGTGRGGPKAARAVRAGREDRQVGKETGKELHGRGTMWQLCGLKPLQVWHG
jgi:hypothetical protein